MSDTPRTDAKHRDVNASEESHAGDILTAMDFARELERELAHAIAERDNYKRAVEESHKTLDECALMAPRSISHGALPRRIEKIIQIATAKNDRPGLSATLARVGDENVLVQSLTSDITAGNVGKKGASITFATDPAFVSDINKCAACGGTPKKLGMVLWVDAEKWEAAKR